MFVLHTGVRTATHKDYHYILNPVIFLLVKLHFALSGHPNSYKLNDYVLRTRFYLMESSFFYVPY
jgi:hypothetical protein